MAHVIDTRGAGGELVVLGDVFTLPTSNAIANPLQGSLRFNPDDGSVEVYLPATAAWSSFATEAYVDENIGNQIDSISNSTTLIATVSELYAAIANCAVGRLGFALDGRKPTEFSYGFSGRTALSNTTGSGTPVFCGYSSDANAVSNTTAWISTLDDLPVST